MFLGRYIGQLNNTTFGKGRTLEAGSLSVLERMQVSAEVKEAETIIGVPYVTQQLCKGQLFRYYQGQVPLTCCVVEQAPMVDRTIAMVD